MGIRRTYKSLILLVLLMTRNFNPWIEKLQGWQETMIPLGLEIHLPPVSPSRKWGTTPCLIRDQELRLNGMILLRSTINGVGPNQPNDIQNVVWFQGPTWGLRAAFSAPISTIQGLVRNPRRRYAQQNRSRFVMPGLRAFGSFRRCLLIPNGIFYV